VEIWGSSPLYRPMKKLLMILLIPTILLSCEYQEAKESDGRVISVVRYTDDTCLAKIKFIHAHDGNTTRITEWFEVPCETTEIGDRFGIIEIE